MRTEAIGTIHRKEQEYLGKTKLSITIACVLKMALQSMPSSDRIIMAEPFIEIKAHSLSFGGIFRASQRYLMSSTQNEWSLFSYRISVRTASVFSSDLRSQHGEASPGPLEGYHLKG